MPTNSLRIALVLIALCGANAADAQNAGVVIHSIKGTFADVRERVVLAIEGRGIVINYNAKVGDMLARTGRDLGRDRQVYDKAEVLEFCSAKLSRDAMEADPRNIAFCPYAIAVYTMPKDPATVYVSYRKLGALGSSQSLKALRAVDQMLEDIVREAR